MCIIIDANVANEFDLPTDDARPVLVRLISKRLRLVSSPELKSELARTKFSKLYRQLMLSGSVKEFEKDKLAVAEKSIAGKELKSNDKHVVVLAIASGVRLLFSRDKALHADFKNKDLLGGEKGKVYTSHKQERILKGTVCGCR